VQPRTAPTGTRPAAAVWAWCALAAVLLGAGAIRVRLLEVPLERDEGEYAYIAQLMREGVPPYVEAYSMKLPGVPAAYAVALWLLGPTASAVHLTLLVVNAITTVLVFLLARAWMDPRGATAAAATFALLSVGQPVQGPFANAEHFVLLFAVAGLWLVARAASGAGPRPLVAGGLLLGVGILMKQHGLAFAACGVLLAGAAGKGRRPRARIARAGVVALAAAAPYAATCLALAAVGAFARFWFWTVECAAAYASQVAPAEAAPLLWARFRPILRASPLVWLLAAVGLVTVVCHERLRSNAARLLAFALCSFAATCPGFFFRPHYFVLLLPAAALFVGAAVEAAADLAARRRRALGPLLAVAIGGAAAGDALARQADFLFRLTPAELARSTYGVDPFPESPEIARYIRERTVPGERIAILGSEPQILFYAQRRSASGHVYTYALMEPHDFALRLQREMIAEIEAAAPRYVVAVEVDTSWLRRPESAAALFEWFALYRERHYRTVGLVEIFPSGRTVYQWDEDVRWPPRSDAYVTVLERRR
jgi:hypothetical protein